MNKNLINHVILQILHDIQDNDLTALEELLKFVDQQKLVDYLPDNSSYFHGTHVSDEDIFTQLTSN